MLPCYRYARAPLQATVESPAARALAERRAWAHCSAGASRSSLGAGSATRSALGRRSARAAFVTHVLPLRACATAGYGRAFCSARLLQRAPSRSAAPSLGTHRSAPPAAPRARAPPHAALWTGAACAQPLLRACYRCARAPLQATVHALAERRALARYAPRAPPAAPLARAPSCGTRHLLLPDNYTSGHILFQNLWSVLFSPLPTRARRTCSRVCDYPFEAAHNGAPLLLASQ